MASGYGFRLIKTFLGEIKRMTENTDQGYEADTLENKGGESPEKIETSSFEEEEDDSDLETDDGEATEALDEVLSSVASTFPPEAFEDDEQMGLVSEHDDAQTEEFDDGYSVKEEDDEDDLEGDLEDDFVERVGSEAAWYKNCISLLLPANISLSL